MRDKKEILSAEEEFFDRVWYDRKQTLRDHEDTTKLPSDILVGMLAAELEVEKKYTDLGPYSDFDWGMINGKLSALRWVMGDDWDQLDT